MSTNDSVCSLWQSSPRLQSPDMMRHSSPTWSLCTRPSRVSHASPTLTAPMTDPHTHTWGKWVNNWRKQHNSTRKWFEIINFIYAALFKTRLQSSSQGQTMFENNAGLKLSKKIKQNRNCTKIFKTATQPPPIIRKHQQTEGHRNKIKSKQYAYTLNEKNKAV